MMTLPKTKKDLDTLISDKIEENQHLEYKAADALQKTDGKKKEIAKDISAMANAAGGIIIYGMKEYDEPEKKHLPEKIIPVDRREISKEWIEQDIHSNISPKIDGLVVYPIPLDDPQEAVYVVEIPQSSTAHQNTADGRYYRRYNFLSVFMMDYEIRDITNRAKHPLIELGFEIEKETRERRENFPVVPIFSQQEKKKEYRTDITLRIFPKNIGTVFAEYINYFVWLPEDIVNDHEAKHLKKPTPGIIEYYGENTHRDVLEYKATGTGYGIPKYGPSRFDPVLPECKGRSEKLRLVLNPKLDERVITWTVHADNASPKTGTIKLIEVPVIEINADDSNE